MKIDINKIYALATSADFRARFIAEYWQLKDRYEKLSAMIAKYEADRLDFEPLCPLRLLKEQREYMLMLIYILQHRAAIESIELNEEDVALTESDESTRNLQVDELVAVSVPGGCQVGLVRELYQDGADILFAGTDNMQYYINYTHICKVTNNEYISVTEVPTEHTSEDNVEADAPFREGEIVVIHEDAIYQVGIVRKVQIGGAWVALHNDSKAYFYKFKELHHIANSNAIKMVEG